MKKTVFFQKIIDSRFFNDWNDKETKENLMYKELENQIKELESKFNWITEYNKNSWIYKAWFEDHCIQYRCNFFITPKKETTYNKIYEIANSVWHATPFKFL